jgi:putative transport protein
MTDWLVAAVRGHAEVAFFLTIGIGYLLGKLRVRGFALGAVTGTLLAGVAVGQLGIRIAPEVKQCFFVLFLFSIGYRCGPQFFQGLRKDGLTQAAIASIVAVTGLAVSYVIARILGYDAGTASGLIAGALTESATIGTAGDAIARLPLDAAAREAMVNRIPVAFAVTYLIGTVGAAWVLAQIAPLVLRVDLAKACADYEARMGGGKRLPPGIVSAYRAIEMRAYRVPEGSDLIGKPISSLVPGERVFIGRIKRDGKIIQAEGATVLRAGDIAAISGRRDLLVQQIKLPEVEAPELLDVPAERLDVFVTGAEIIGKSLRELSDHPAAYGIYLRRVLRNNMAMPITSDLVVRRGDVLTLVGSQERVDAVARRIGVPDRPEESTDMVFVSAGIVVGALIGLPALALGRVELGLSLSVGVLFGGLVWGWFNSLRPMIGRIPTPTLWIFESLGLTGFIAVVGISAGPDFVHGLQASGVSLIVAGLVTVTIPHLVGALVGVHVFKMHPGIVLGVCAGAGTATPALAAVQEVAKSAVPTLGYGVAYAVGNVLLALWGTVIVALLG